MTKSYNNNKLTVVSVEVGLGADPVGRPSTSVVNRGENGRVMPRPYNNPKMQ